MTPKLRLLDLAKRFGGEPALRGVSVEVPEGAVVVLLGPSGCGKTTVLRLAAGLLTPDAGSIWLDDRQVAGPGWGVPPERRNLAMVFQSYALWPHRTVAENVAYGLRVRRLPRETIRRRVERALELVRLPGLGHRYPAELSGGQQQRVALARAIVVEPAILLLDEPLSNLDAALREEMRAELRALQRALGLTCVYVTHDQAEALVLADHLAVMRAGRVEQAGTPEALYRRPRSRFVASFLGATNLVRGRLRGLEGLAACLEVPGLGALWGTVGAEAAPALQAGAEAWLSVRPGDLTVAAARPDPATRAPGGPGPTAAEPVNALAGRVLNRAFLGDAVELVVETAGAAWRVRAHPTVPFGPGQAVWLLFGRDAGTVGVDE